MCLHEYNKFPTWHVFPDYPLFARGLSEVTQEGWWLWQSSPEPWQHEYRAVCAEMHLSPLQCGSPLFHFFCFRFELMSCVKVQFVLFILSCMTLSSIDCCLSVGDSCPDLMTSSLMDPYQLRSHHSRLAVHFSIQLFLSLHLQGQ